MVVIKQKGNWKLEENKSFDRNGEERIFWSLVHERTQTLSNTRQTVTRDLISWYNEEEHANLKALFSD